MVSCEKGISYSAPVDTPLGSFLTDLAVRRPELEIRSLEQSLTEKIFKEQQRLEERSSVSTKDAILGYAPFTTPFDKLQGTPEFLPIDQTVRALTHRYYNIWIFNQPQRIASLKESMKCPYVPPLPKDIPIIDEATKNHLALDFEDLGFVVEEPYRGEKTIEHSARVLLSKGPFTYIADNLVAIPYILSSMPDVAGSMSVATHALSGGLAFVPFDSIWESKENRLQVALEAWKIVSNDPVLASHSDKEFLLRHYKRLIGITIKANGHTGEEVKFFVKNGFTTFRIYDARSRNTIEDGARDIQQTIAADPELKKIVDTITLFAGQVTGPEQVKRLQAVGVNAVIVGIGGGGICKTPQEASLHTSNVNVGREILKSGVTIPVVFDGGIGPRMPVLFAMGGAAGLKSAALVGGTIEQPPCLYYYRLSNGSYGKNYSGEAAPRTKYGGEKLDFLGRPLFVEGTDEMTLFNKTTPSMTDNTWALLQSLATSMIFTHVESIRDFHKIRRPNFWLATEKAKRRSDVHHSNGI
jgi:hypothetical protein